MIFSDRRLNSVLAGLVLMGAVSGCRSARYQTADSSPGTATYAGTPVVPQSGPVREPPSAFGPREPVPVSVPDEPYESQAPVPDDPSAARSYDLGPALRSVPEESPVDEDLKFPEASRRTKSIHSLRALLSSGRKKPGAEFRTASDKLRPSGRSTLRAGSDAGAQGQMAARPVPHADPVAVVDGQPPKSELEPVLLTDLPSLVPPPATATVQVSGDRQDLRIDRIALCNEVRGYDDVAQIDPLGMQRNVPFLVYVSLQNFRSRASHDGVRTLTRSQAELRTLAGEVVWRQALGTANDVSPKPRHQYFLAHQIAIPAQIPAGNYILSLRVEDLLAEQSAIAQVPVRIQGGS